MWCVVLCSRRKSSAVKRKLSRAKSVAKEEPEPVTGQKLIQEEKQETGDVC